MVKDEPKQIPDKIIQLAKNIKTNNPTGSVAISSILTCSDGQSSPKHVAQTNKVVKSACSIHGFDFILNDNVGRDCLNKSGLHLNRKGIYNIACNFKNYIDGK